MNTKPLTIALLFVLVAVSCYLVQSTVVFAQTPAIPKTPVDEVTDLKFPISDLGNCTSYKSCSTYCDDPVNNAICVDYAKKSGFYKDDPVIAPSTDFLNKAQKGLGCDSAESCLDFCSQPANYGKCDSFAKSNKMIGGYVAEPDKPQFLTKAKEVLGCDSVASCSSLCDAPANASKCGTFADSVGLLGGQTSVGPGGCSSSSTCQSFCSDPSNFNKCSTFASSSGGSFTGPGGCNSSNSCRNRCEENPSECRSYAPGSNGNYMPVSCHSGEDYGPGGVCTSVSKMKESGTCAQAGKYWNGSGCMDQAPEGVHPNVGGGFYQPRPEMANCSTPGQCYDYCKENPGKCAGFDSTATRPKDGYIPTLYYTPGTEVKFAVKTDMGNCDSPGSCYDYCKENPGKCGGFDSKSPRPVDVYTPGTYYTPSSDYTYFTPPATSFYVTPIYYTPPAGSNYTTPTYYTPGTYSTPTYYTPLVGTNYTTPTYYTPGGYYNTPSGSYTTPAYLTPFYYTPPANSGYNTPSYYTPATYTSPSYYTPPAGSSYTSPVYNTPPAYQTPSYYTPYTGGAYTTPTYYTPPAGSNYTTPSYPSPSYYTPSGTYSYPSPNGSYATPTSGNYPTPSSSYYTPGSYSYPSPGSNYTSPSGYSYPSPGSYMTPPSGYPSPGSSYPTPTYNTPSSSYSQASYSYNTPSNYSQASYSYNTPSYNSPSYGSPSYSTPPEYSTPVQGVSTSRSQGFLESILNAIFKN